ncbi:MAG: iolG 9 [Verrucomicrobiaceae bacterium]|nr:iolG 9 [Verrucomicrobiaceae bacterium]
MLLAFIHDTMHSILIIGCGSIGERHLRCFQKTGRCTVVACDTSQALLATMRERYAVPTFSSLDEAMAAGSYDAAVICTPANLHLPMAMKLLRANLDLFIEKPLAIDAVLVPETRQVIQQTGKHVAVAYVYHSMPWVAGAREYVRSGALGKILHASVDSG